MNECESAAEPRLSQKRPQRRFAPIWWLPSLLPFLLFFIGFLGASFPRIGHDYEYFVPQLLAGKAHFMAQGLAPFRYSPYFCGGMVAHGNPQNPYYSLLQVFTFFMEPWYSLLLCIVLVLLLGYRGWYLVGRDVLGLKPEWRHLLALIVVSSGFTLAHLVAGHVTFFAFPLVSYFVWFLFKPGNLSFRALLSDAAIVSLLAGMILYAGGYIVLLYTALGLSLALPLYLIVHPTRERLLLLLSRIAFFAIGSLALGMSKITAVISFMTHVPRVYSLEHFSAEAILSHAFKALWVIPQTSRLFTEVAWWDVHEKTMLLSPVTIIGMVLLPWIWYSTGRVAATRFRRILFYAWVVFIAIVLLQLASGTGPFAETLWKLSLLKAIRVPIRFLYIPSVFIACGSVYALAIFVERHFWRHSMIIVFFLSLLTVASFKIGFPDQTMQNMVINYDYGKVRQALVASPDPPPVTVLHDPASVMEGHSSVDCYEPLFDSSGKFSVHALHVGPVTDVRDDTFNMINPSCYQYPEENNCFPGDRIPASDEATLESFRRSGHTPWKISTAQLVSDWVSLVSLGMLLLLTFVRRSAPKISGLI